MTHICEVSNDARLYGLLVLLKGCLLSNPATTFHCKTYFLKQYTMHHYFVLFIVFKYFVEKKGNRNDI